MKFNLTPEKTLQITLTMDEANELQNVLLGHLPKHTTNDDDLSDWKFRLHSKSIKFIEDIYSYFGIKEIYPNSDVFQDIRHQNYLFDYNAVLRTMQEKGYIQISETTMINGKKKIKSFRFIKSII